MMERSNILSNDPDWKISVRVRGPTGTISKKLQKKTTSVHPNKGITLHEVLNQLDVHIKLDNPDEWEIEALKHRSPDDRPRKTLHGTVKDILMHYRKRVTGHFCFFLVRRRVGTNAPAFEERYQVRVGQQQTSGRTMTKKIPRHSHGKGRSHASLPLNCGSGLETWMNHHQGQGRNQQEVASSGSGMIYYRNGKFTTNVQLLQDTHVMKKLCSLPKNGWDRLATGANKVNLHVVNVKQSPVARFSSGANPRFGAHGSAQQNGNRDRASRDKPEEQHRFTAVAVKCYPNSKPYSKEDINKRLEALAKYPY